MKRSLRRLDRKLDGRLQYDNLTKILYATDASVYREMPLAVAFPKTTADIQKLVAFAQEHETSLIPRTAGTSLAGQCVGDGIVVDVSKYFTDILEFNKEEQWVSVQPGVVRDQLNAFLKPHGLFFSPITSTANRAMIGGMVGNNSCGTNSIVYGSTRDHVLELKTVLSDGTEAVFGDIDEVTFHRKTKQNSLEGLIYKRMYEDLRNPEVQKEITTQFPKPSIHRRNTGYAVDSLIASSIFDDIEAKFNFCKLLSGSEGTLAFTTEIKIHLDVLPQPFDVVLAAHFKSINESMRATQLAMEHHPDACELMDKIILDCTKENIEQRKNRAFVEGDPEAILLLEFRGASIEEAELKAKGLIDHFKNEKLGYAFPIVQPPLTKSVWQLRSAGLGLLANIPGDKKAVACIEDTAVALEDLPEYIDEFSEMMQTYDQRAVYYAHAGAGEIHLRPILNLKDTADRKAFHDITKSTAALVKKYNGALSGEHGDGRVRAPFIKDMVGEKNYALFQRIKRTWDPQHIFNPGKIVDAPAMNEHLRYEADQENKVFETAFDFDRHGGILQAAEQCNGSGDCRKLTLSGGTMCPSYQATRNESDTTRGRANALREVLTRSNTENPFDHEDLKEVMDLCISCKGCTSECPSNVDMSTLKAEFSHQYQKANGVPLRSKVFANINSLNSIGGVVPWMYNFLMKNTITSGIAKSILGVAKERSLPTIQSSLHRWYRKNYRSIAPANPIKSLYFFCDEFTNWNDVEIGRKAIQLLAKLNYDVKVIDHEESGRAAISKGLLEKAKTFAEQNVEIFGALISNESVLVGIEPSAVLSFKDEYPRLVRKDLKDRAESIANNTMLIDGFIAQEIREGRIDQKVFTTKPKKIKFHGHCHQKALTNIEDSIWLMSLPENYEVEPIPSGCCGMAGSFGYEKEHYDISQRIGELILFPTVRSTNESTIIAATGTSCRHQIKDGTGRKAMHPIEVLWEALSINENQ